MCIPNGRSARRSGLGDTASRAWQALEGTVVELGQERPDRRVPLVQTEETLVTQSRRYPTGTKQYRQIDPTFIVRPVGSTGMHIAR
jgi:hypothetical protein